MLQLKKELEFTRLHKEKLSFLSPNITQAHSRFSGPNSLKITGPTNMHPTEKQRNTNFIALSP